MFQFLNSKKRQFFGLALFAIAATLIAFLFFWYTTQAVPLIVIQPKGTAVKSVKVVPLKNQSILSIIESSGQDIAPSYHQAVCTEFVILVLERITPLNAKIKKGIRIITKDNLDSLVEVEASVIKGVQSALIDAGIGTLVKSEDVCEGDLVQFWNTFAGEAYGHCGFVIDAKPKEYITIYSSHPITGGFGKQTFPWPEKAYFVRVKD